MGKMICFKDMFGLFDTIPNIVEQADEWAFFVTAYATHSIPGVQIHSRSLHSVAAPWSTFLKSPADASNGVSA